MASALTPMTPDQRQRFGATYLAWLRVRDGVPDLEARRFDVRERFFTRIDADPRRWVGPPPVAQAAFDEGAAGPDADDALLWALATAKTNRAERFGVELSITHDARSPADRIADPHTYIQVEEFYHTRILEDALATIGLKATVGAPSMTTQALVRAMVHLPASISDLLVFCGEIVGVTLFTLLLERARTLFGHQPEAMARIEALFAQILVDEVGHVQFLRSRMTPTKTALARRLIPIVVANVVSDIPELDRLFGRAAIVAHALRADVDASAAAYPDRLIFDSAA